jgi:hypothetical protein
MIEKGKGPFDKGKTEKRQSVQLSASKGDGHWRTFIPANAFRLISFNFDPDMIAFRSEMPLHTLIWFVLTQNF